MGVLLKSNSGPMQLRGPVSSCVVHVTVVLQHLGDSWVIVLEDICSCEEKILSFQISSKAVFLGYILQNRGHLYKLLHDLTLGEKLPFLLLELSI